MRWIMVSRSARGASCLSDQFSAKNQRGVWECHTSVCARTRIPCENCMRDAGITDSGIKEVILVGGMTRMPRVQQMAEEITTGHLDIAPRRTDHERSACTYCDYKGICKFDKDFPECRYVHVHKIKNEETPSEDDN